MPMKIAPKSGQHHKKDRERGFQLRTDRAYGNLVVVLMIPIVVSVREVNIMHFVWVVPVLGTRPVPMRVA